MNAPLNPALAALVRLLAQRAVEAQLAAQRQTPVKENRAA